jgi:hypothetical protein
MHMSLSVQQLVFCFVKERERRDIFEGEFANRKCFSSLIDAANEEISSSIDSIFD